MMNLTVDERWDLIGEISSRTVSVGGYREGLKDALAELTVNPWVGIPLAIAVLYGFWSFFGSFAGFFTDGYMVPIFDEYWTPWLMENFPNPDGWLFKILVGEYGAGSAMEAFGVLTSGLFVAIGIVLPAIVAFYLFLIVMEDLGYLPRLAVLMDTLLHRIGLHGFAIVPMILSLGCNVPGVTATRNLTTKKQRFMMMALLSVFIPCGAQLGVMLVLVPQYAGWIIAFLIAGFFTFGWLLNRLIRGSTPEILMDVPPYRMPKLRVVANKLWVRLRGFFTTAIPFVLLGVVVVQILYLTGAMDSLASFFAPLLTEFFGVPEEAVAPLVAGFLRKDLAIAQLENIEMSMGQLITSIVMISLYFPCLATFIMIMKEGWTEGTKGIVTHLAGSLLVLVAVLFVWTGVLRLILTLGGIE
ncbi:MAG: nucleoside recognition domain-containing protein [Thermoplasmatota archaeon]